MKGSTSNNRDILTLTLAEFKLVLDLAFGVNCLMLPLDIGLSCST